MIELPGWKKAVRLVSIHHSCCPDGIVDFTIGKVSRSETIWGSEGVVQIWRCWGWAILTVSRTQILVVGSTAFERTERGHLSMMQQEERGFVETTRLLDYRKRKRS